MLCLQWLCTGCLLAVAVRGEMFTAIIEMEKALVAEGKISHELREYVKAEQQRLSAVLKIADEYEQHSAIALKDPLAYLSHPVNAFLLVKRFTTDWEKVHMLLSNQSTPVGFEARIDELRAELPAEEDLKGSAAALFRLQDTYKLSSGQLAQGDIAGAADLSPQMQASECFELGRIAYFSQDYYHTVLWMTEALERESGEVNKTASRPEILDYLSFATSMHGNTKHALELTNELLSLDPDHPRAGHNKDYYERMLADQEEKMRSRGDDGSDPVDVDEFKLERDTDEYHKSPEFAQYEALCRGEDVIPNPYEHQLRCRYETKNHPLLLLAPLKTEELYLDPLIVVFRDMMNDREMEKVKGLARPMLNRATVQNPATGKLEPANYRVSKSAWLKDWDHPIIQRITNRIEAATGLDQGTAEELQVVNYGLGGHYEPHYDFARKEEAGSFQEFQGNRIATILFYMSDVAAGGATVFTDIGIKIWPEKGSAGFWWNLKDNLEGDFRTRHAGCPVLVGSKWVSNKWIHERGQEFRRPCNAANPPQ